jgi:hypothetical protein
MNLRFAADRDEKVEVSTAFIFALNGNKAHDFGQ